MALDWDEKPGLVGYLSDREVSRKRAQAGPPRCECDRGPLVNSADEDPTCQRCGKAVSAVGRPLAA